MSVCTFQSNDGNPMEQVWYECKTCFCGCCAVCAELCHKNHEIKCCGKQPSRLCDCFHGVGGYLCKCNKASYRYCTSIYFRKILGSNQPWYHCKTCNLTESNGMCKACAIQCHYGHEIEFVGNKFMKCKCRDTRTCHCDKLQIEVFKRPLLEKPEEIGDRFLTYLLYEDKTASIIIDNLDRHHYNEKYIENSGIKYRVNQVGYRRESDIKNESNTDLYSYTKTELEYIGLTRVALMSPHTKIIHPLANKYIEKYRIVDILNPRYFDLHWQYLAQNNQLITIFKDSSFKKIPNTITHLRPYASTERRPIEGFESLYESSLKVIGEFAFIDNEIPFSNLPTSVQEIKEGAFINAIFSCTTMVFLNDSLLKYIGDKAFSTSNISSITLPKSLVYIGDKSFFECQNLEHVVFLSPSKLEIIGKRAFKSTKVSEIDMPSTVKVIGEECFNRNIVIKKLIYSKNMAFENIKDYKINSIVVSTDAIDIPENFMQSRNIEIIIEKPSKVRVFGKAAFKASEIPEMEIPASTTVIDDECFDESLLVKLTFCDESNLERIGNKSFMKTKISKLEIPASVRELGDECFHDASKLQTIKFAKPSVLEKIGNKCLMKTKIMNIEIPASVREIGDYCFFGSLINQILFEQTSHLVRIGKNCFKNTNIENIDIPSSVEEIGESAFISSGVRYVHFEEDSQLKMILSMTFSSTMIEAIEIPKKVEIIKEYAFNESKLEFIRFKEPSCLRILEKYAFSGTLIKEICLPTSLKEIGSSCFADCPRLTKIEFAPYSNLSILHNEAFKGTRIQEIVLPSTLQEIGSQCFIECPNLTKVEFAENCILFKLHDEAFRGTKIKELKLPPYLQEIGQNCFINSNQLTRITFDKISTIKKINDYVFNQSEISRIDLPRSLQEIGNFCFVNCPIKSITIPSSVVTIGSKCFYQCKNLTEVRFQKESSLQTIGIEAFLEIQIKAITIPSSVVCIKEGCFKKTSLVNVFFEKGSNLKIIEKEAFKGTRLERIDLPNSVEEIGDLCFESTKITRFRFPKSLKRFDPLIFDEQMRDLEFDSINPNFVWDEISLYDRNVETLLFHNPLDQKDIFLVPPSILNIHERALKFSNNIREIKFHPDSVIESVQIDYLPKSLEKICFSKSIKSFTCLSKQKAKFVIKQIVVGSTENSFTFDANLRSIGLDFNGIKIIAGTFARILWSDNSSLSLFKIERTDKIESYFREFRHFRPVKNIFVEDEGAATQRDEDDVNMSSSQDYDDDEHTEVRISDYIMDFSELKEIKLIGNGGFGRVVLMKNKNTGQLYAVKIITAVTENNDGESFMREVEILCNTSHPCINKIIGYKYASDQNDIRVPPMIALEYMPNGTIEHIFKKVRDGEDFDFFDDTRKTIMILGIAMGMRYLHNIGILHRDLKPANILLDKEYHIQIGDFGISKFDEIGITCTKNIGTLFYATPESYSNVPFDVKADVYAFGMILFEMAVGEPAFSEKYSPQVLMKKKMDGDYKEIPDDVLPLTRSLIESCLDLNPTKRPTFDEIIKKIKVGKLKLFEGANRNAAKDYYENIQKEVNERRQKNQNENCPQKQKIQRAVTPRNLKIRKEVKPKSQKIEETE